MLRPVLLALVALAALAAAPVGAETGSAFDRSVERLVGVPTPVGPFLLASDQASWRVDVPPEAIVTVEARGSPSAPFYLRAHREGASPGFALLPTSHAGFILGGPGAWRVVVDPAGGASVDILVRFRGHVADASGAPASFTLTDLGADRGCVVPGVCLP